MPSKYKTMITVGGWFILYAMTSDGNIEGEEEEAFTSCVPQASAPTTLRVAPNFSAVTSNTKNDPLVLQANNSM